ncbi:hypothetical protein BB560_004013, partial [Smittium megazygosporum]
MDNGELMDLVNGDRLKYYYHSNRMIPELQTSGLRPTLRKFREHRAFILESHLQNTLYWLSPTSSSTLFNHDTRSGTPDFYG